ncbi:riboflavin kinase / FMN adenylyltransferase [Lishizhenia tianjinensis]|uniref:Riboflavin biosynthesis protein n=1 Tax=Lishizhenia tianjinensis TaxID=477690 RepID=A0A1I7BRD9_9FLAO|nr:riboflavin kinase / FMN adenylyltransferase [Lishizhenia tianjinensis]
MKQIKASVRIIKGFDNFEQIPNPVITIGTFDGVHIGHQKIIQQLNEEAEKIGGESVLFTFYPHPRMVLFPDSHGIKLIQTQIEKLNKLKEVGLKNVVVFPFTKEFSRLTATEFVRDYLVAKLQAKMMVIGYDHQFGKNREGTLELLKELAPIYDFDVKEIAAQDIEEVNVSSTKIRRALLDGDIYTANKYLGAPFTLSGKVIRGNEIGRSIQFPTANLDVDGSMKLIPAQGVYAVKVTLESGSDFYGLLNIGTRPTVDNADHLSVEVHILDFKGDLYGQELTLTFLKRIRNEEKFSSLDALKAQIEKDEVLVRHTILEHNW